MATNLYRVIDTIEDKVILDNVYSNEVVKHFKGAFTNVSRYATLGTFYQKRYKFELVGIVAKGPCRRNKETYESEYQSQEAKKLDNAYTHSMLYNKCLKYKIGDLVNIKVSVKDEDGKCYITQKIPATVIERYPFHLIVEKESGVQESFIYADIVLFEVLESRRTKQRKVS